MEGDVAVKGIDLNQGLSTFLKSMTVTKKSTESIQETEAINLF